MNGSKRAGAVVALAIMTVVMLAVAAWVLLTAARVVLEG